jgi:hypothetical protein
MVSPALGRNLSTSVEHRLGAICEHEKQFLFLSYACLTQQQVQNERSLALRRGRLIRRFHLGLVDADPA